MLLFVLIVCGSASFIAVSGRGRDSPGCGDSSNACATFVGASQSTLFKPQDSSVTIFVADADTPIMINQTAFFQTSQNATILSFLGNGVQCVLANASFVSFNTTSARLIVRGFNFVSNAHSSSLSSEHIDVVGLFLSHFCGTVPIFTVGLASVYISDVSSKANSSQFRGPRLVDFYVEQPTRMTRGFGSGGHEFSVDNVQTDQGFVWFGNMTSSSSIIRISRLTVKTCMSYVEVGAVNIFVENSFFQDASVLLIGSKKRATCRKKKSRFCLQVLLLVQRMFILACNVRHLAITGFCRCFLGPR